MYVVLTPADANDATDLCSRRPPYFLETWLPKDDDIAALEAHWALLRVTDPVPICCGLHGSVGSMDAYYRQYIGIIVEKRRSIYINAFAVDSMRLEDLNEPGWLRRPKRVCDGGTHFWGAVYDPSAGTFSDLRFNWPYWALQ